MFLCLDFRARAGSRAIRNEPTLYHFAYSRVFASIRGLKQVLLALHLSLSLIFQHPGNQAGHCLKSTIRRRAKIYRRASTSWAKRCWAKNGCYFSAHTFFCPERPRACNVVLTVAYVRIPQLSFAAGRCLKSPGGIDMVSHDCEEKADKRDKCLRTHLRESKH